MYLCDHTQCIHDLSHTVLMTWHLIYLWLNVHCIWHLTHDLWHHNTLSITSVYYISYQTDYIWQHLHCIRESQKLSFNQPVIKAFPLRGKKVKAVIIAVHHIDCRSDRKPFIIYCRHDRPVYLMNNIIQIVLCLHPFLLLSRCRSMSVLLCISSKTEIKDFLSHLSSDVRLCKHSGRRTHFAQKGTPAVYRSPFS